MMTFCGRLTTLSKQLGVFFAIFLVVYLGLFPASGWAEDPSFLLSLLLKPSAVEISLSDLGPEAPALLLDQPEISRNSDQSARFTALSKFLLSEIVAAPGHRMLRKPEQIQGLTEYIQHNSGGDFSKDKVLVNVVVDEKNPKTWISVDLWNAHHRLVAYLEAGYIRVGELNPHNIEILVNGYTVRGEQWRHFVPAAGLDLEKSKISFEYVTGGGIRPGTISVLGAISNYSLGSRNTVGRLHKNLFKWKRPKIGVYFGTFDPIHEGHMALIKHALEHEGFDEVVLIPNIRPHHKPHAMGSKERLKMLALRIANEPKVNLYTIDSAFLVDRFSRNSLIERISQIYGTTRIFQIVGQDAYNRLVKEGNITPKDNRKYLIYFRGQNLGSSLSVPDQRGTYIPSTLREMVLFADYHEKKSYSSTQIRQKLHEGVELSSGELDPTVYSYIQYNKFYQKPVITRKNPSKP
jgi:nicotinate (nicotinamide) nucleotide adenylyltransferase